jgi:phosphosulfolactate synthase
MLAAPRLSAVVEMTEAGLAFPDVTIPVGPAKPRERGITMMIDWGLPLAAQEDLLRLAGDYIDLAKVAVGISGLLPLEVLREKVASYRNHAVDAFPGGMFFEFAFAHGEVDAYLDGCGAAEYRTIEVSDNALPLARADKDRLIRQARERGFRVLGEVGSKHTKTPTADLVADFKACMEAGCWKVFVEAAELLEDGQLRTDLLERLGAEVDPASVIWELPGTWIEQVHSHEVHALESWLVEHLGSGVNIANVPSDGVLVLETHRRGIGVRTLADRLPVHG